MEELGGHWSGKPLEPVTRDIGKIRWLMLLLGLFLSLLGEEVCVQP